MNVIEGGSLSGYAAFGRLASRGTVEHLQERKGRFRSNIVNERIGRLIDDFDRSTRRLSMIEFKDELRIAKRREKNLFDDGHIRYVHEVEDIQHVNNTMRRLIMSDPRMRELARKNQIEGWSTVYKDPDEGKDGWRHRDYRRLNQGVYRKNEESGDIEANYYYETQGADDLTLTEKLDAFRTIDRIKSLIRKRGEDPTSINGGSLN